MQLVPLMCMIVLAGEEHEITRSQPCGLQEVVDIVIASALRRHGGLQPAGAATSIATSATPPLFARTPSASMPP